MWTNLINYGRNRTNMERRQALAYTVSILGGTIIGAEVLLSGCTSKPNNQAIFSQKDIEKLDEIGETILPETDNSPGAKAAKIGEFINTILTDCYKKEEVKLITEGLHEIEAVSLKKYRKTFISLSQTEKFDLISAFDRISAEKKKTDDIYFFSMLKELIIWGYFSSEPGVTKALRYNPIPGRFKGCVDYSPGDKAWY